MEPFSIGSFPRQPQLKEIFRNLLYSPSPKIGKKLFTIHAVTTQSIFAPELPTGKLSYRSLRNKFSFTSISSHRLNKQSGEGKKYAKSINCRKIKNLLQNIKSNYFYASFDSLLMKWSEFWNRSSAAKQLLCQAFLRSTEDSPST